MWRNICILHDVGVMCPIFGFVYYSFWSKEPEKNWEVLIVKDMECL